jgi:large subunit ribosomal protein L17
MRHHKANRKLGRKRNQRKALIKSQAVSLVLKEKITTTEAKAKELKPFVERLISYGKKSTLSSKRQVVSTLGPLAGKKVNDVLSERYKSRNGGYLRILKVGRRVKDGGVSSIIQFV